MSAPQVPRLSFEERYGTLEGYVCTVRRAATVTVADGVLLPYLVRVERGTLNRGIHEIAVLFDPARSWTPLEPQPHWGRKLLLKYGGGTGQVYRQGNPPAVLDDEALRLGFVVASSSMLVNGLHANFVTAAETSVMLKEHVIETYGELRYTIGEGGSGGALLQYLIADAYPGILDGLRPTQDWEDSVSAAYREFVDSAVVMQAIESSNLTYTDEHRAAIGGWGGTNVTVFNTESRRVVDYIQPDDRDGRWKPERNSLSVETLRTLYRTGQVTQGRGLARVPILAIRGTNNDDYHYPYRTIVNRARLVAANGHADNHVYWIAPPRGAGVSTLEAMDRWLSAIEADRSDAPVPRKVVSNRPADIISGCWIDGQRTDDLAQCDAAYPYEREPRTMAGDGPTIATMKCQLKPLSPSDYRVTFTDEQWRQLEQTFAEGVCDFSRPGVGVQPTVEWLTYSTGPGGTPLGPPPRSN